MNRSGLIVDINVTLTFVCIRCLMIYGNVITHAIILIIITSHYNVAIHPDIRHYCYDACIFSVITKRIVIIIIQWIEIMLLLYMLFYGRLCMMKAKWPKAWWNKTRGAHESTKVQSHSDYFLRLYILKLRHVSTFRSRHSFLFRFINSLPL